jgi:PTS system nitrogen regulatory IIA component
MQLTIREAASYLGVNEATMTRWIEQRGLPAHRASERWYVNPVELWEWAVEQRIPASRSLLDQARGKDTEVAPLTELLREGGIFHDVPGTNKAEVLRALVDLLPLPPEQDRGSLLDILEAREALGSTGIGHGIAIPHVRNPIVLHVERPFVTLALLRNPVEFGAVDGNPVDTLFTVVTPSVTAHLGILARLGFVLHDQELRGLLRARAQPQDILARVAVVENTRRTGEFPAASTSSAHADGR